MWRFVQTLFRRKEIFIVPVFVVPLVVLATLGLSEDRYEASAVAWVESPLLLDSTSTRSGVEANEREEQRLRQWLSTSDFRLGLLEKAELLEPARRGEWPPRSTLQAFLSDTGLARVIPLRPLFRVAGLLPPENAEQRVKAAMAATGRSMEVNAEGTNLLHIRYRGPDPNVAQRLVDATIALYQERSFQQRTQQVEQSIAFYTRQLQQQEQRLREAGGRLQTFLREHPAPTGAEAAELENLRNAFEFEQTLYENVLRTLDSVRIQGEATASSIQGSIQVIDPPEAGQSAGLGLRRIALMLFTGFVLGGLLGAAGIMLLTWLDPVVRSREDVIQAVDAPVHLQVPHAPPEAKHWPHLGRLLARDL